MIVSHEVWGSGLWIRGWGFGVNGLVAFIINDAIISNNLSAVVYPLVSFKPFQSHPSFSSQCLIFPSFTMFHEVYNYIEFG